MEKCVHDFTQNHCSLNNFVVFIISCSAVIQQMHTIHFTFFFFRRKKRKKRKEKKKRTVWDLTDVMVKTFISVYYLNGSGKRKWAEATFFHFAHTRIHTQTLTAPPHPSASHQTGGKHSSTFPAIATSTHKPETGVKDEIWQKSRVFPSCVCSYTSFSSIPA